MVEIYCEETCRFESNESANSMQNRDVVNYGKKLKDSRALYYGNSVLSETPRLSKGFQEKNSMRISIQLHISILPLRNTKELLRKIYQFFVTEKEKNKPWALQNPIKRLVKATDDSDDAVQDVVKAVHKAAVQKTVKKNQKLDDFDKGVVRRTIYDLHKKSQSVTMPSLQQALKKKDIDVSISTVSRTVRLLGFRFYKNASSRRFVSEREDIVLMRMTYLRKIRKFRQQGRHIVYLDETWLNTNHVVKGDWLDVPSTSMSVFEPHCKGTHRKVPSGKGTRS
ncbi:unnamed protein product [Mytilus coruscus]|uniref:Uncharacterized protein n=1 Tax=Mytilus coruscus TaxID=42192 RepID=A0A6J8AHY6_MYTCO|nr:unnamed protein product [Mytilus coruscus]